MWIWVHKNIPRIHAHHISEDLSNEHYKKIDGITQMIVDAVSEYNEILPLLENFEGMDADECLIKEAEEEFAKVFLDGILNIVQRRNTESDFFR
ncbi:Uncharacterised protein [uncultured archaeon]|nr:Uncharacterised protein [uncultured archaeon]